MQTIKWLLGLDQGKLIIAMLMIAISALFVQNQMKETQKDTINSTFRKELMDREDSCEAEKQRLLQSKRRVEELLDSLLMRSRRAEAEIDSTIHYNRRLLDSAKYDVSNVKKLLKYDPSIRH